jgi:hypothetical protein
MIDETKNVSRREFLKIAGIAGATIGLGTGLGGFVAGCGKGSTDDTAGVTTTVSIPNGVSDAGSWRPFQASR